MKSYNKCTILSFFSMASMLTEFLFSDEITASFRRFGHLFVDWPHKAESKSYFPPKGEPNQLNIIFLPAGWLYSTVMMSICLLCAHSLFCMSNLSRICIPAVSRRELCSGSDWCLHSGGWQALPVCLQSHHQRQACEFILLSCYMLSYPSCPTSTKLTQMLKS